MKNKANILGFCLYNTELLRENSESIKYAPTVDPNENVPRQGPPSQLIIRSVIKKSIRFILHF